VACLREEREQQAHAPFEWKSPPVGKKTRSAAIDWEGGMLNDATKTIRLADESDVFKGKTENRRRKRTRRRKGTRHARGRSSSSIVTLKKPPPKKPGDPKIAKGNRITNFRPLPCCARENAARSWMKTS